MPPTEEKPAYTAETILEELKVDNKVKLAGLDVDGMLRGKMISMTKFKSIIGGGGGFGFCSVVFGWDMLDKTYFKELLISNAENGYHDVVAKVDIQSFRRIPWEDNVPFFLVSFYDPDTDEPLAPCPRGLLKKTIEKYSASGMGAMAGAEYEFFQFLATPSELATKPTAEIQTITPGMFGYSLTRPILYQSYYYGIYDTCIQFRVPIEGWHTESGPGVYEAALAFTDVQEMADRASLFKLVVKSLGNKNGIIPCFMAKPRQGLPGNSGHLHISIIDKDGKNLFARETKDANPPFPDLANVSDLGRQFLAGLLEGLPSIMPLFAPTVNSYKRLVENFWAPVTVSWGLEHRAASIRLIGPPTASPKATRFEIRVPGADCNPHYALSAILALGYRGIEKKLEVKMPPLGKGEETGGGERLARTLREATEKFMEKGSIAREVLGDAFVEHYGGTREHEVRVWDEAVTDWEIKRYMETV